MAKLRIKYPLITNFTAPPPSTMIDPLGVVTTTEYSAPADVDVTKYRDIRYPQWINECRKILGKLHHRRDKCEPKVELRWSIINEGNRPASQVRVVFKAKGPLSLQRPLADNEIEEDDSSDDDSSQVAAEPRPRFPQSPNPPAFGIYVKHPLAAVEQKLAKEFNLTSLIEASPANQRKPISDVSKLFGTIQQNSNFLRLSSVT